MQFAPPAFAFCDCGHVRSKIHRQSLMSVTPMHTTPGTTRLAEITVSGHGATGGSLPLRGLFRHPGNGPCRPQIG